MLRKILFVLGIAALTGNYAVAQNATIKGRVIDAESKAPVESASIQLMRDGQMELGTRTDEKGNFVLSPVASGTYDLVVSYIKYQKYTLKDLEIRGNITKIIDDVPLETSDKVLKIVEIKADRPIIEMGSTTNDQRVSSEEIKNMPGRSLGAVLATMGGVTSTASGTSYRGNRYGEEGYMVDGVAVSMSPPNIAIAELNLMQGAIPAEYAESTVIEIETKGYSSNHHGSVEARGNLQGYNNYLLEFYFTGPVAKRVMKDDEKKSVFIGYSLSGQGSYSGGDVVLGGTYRASQKTIDYLTEEPFRTIEGGSDRPAISPNLNYVTKYQEGEILSLEEKKRLRVQNAWGASGNVMGRLDFRITKDLDLMLRGGIAYSKGKSWDFANSLFNSKNNGMSEGLSWDLNARITHRIKTDPNSKIKNVFYRLYGYYYHGNSSYYSDVHKDRVFDYGYIGKFDYIWGNAYELTPGYEWDGQKRDVWIMQTPKIVAINFDGSTSTNPDLAKYTSSAIDRLVSFGGLDPTGTTRSGELYNGELPQNAAYRLFRAPGVPFNGYGKSLNDRATAKAIFSFDIGNHSVKFGFDFEQSIARSYSMSPVGLWKIMRNIANKHIEQMDFDHPIPVYDEFGRFLDTINYGRLESPDAQSRFAEKIREKLGVGSKEWVNIDAYEPTMYSLDMFSPDDLFNNGQTLDQVRILSFYGYNYTGTKTTNNPITMDDMKKWFNGKHNNMDFETIGASKPMRISAYLMDKFSIKSLFFDLGLRLDIFDKNQPYVKDMFLYRDAFTVAEAIKAGRISPEIQGSIPNFIGDNPDNYYVYVANADAATVNITAYRSGKTWYNAKGQEVTDPDKLATEAGATKLTPLYKQAPETKDFTLVSHTAFAAYTPTFNNGGISLSPRIAFAFAVGEFSKFTASYNIITKDKSQGLNPVTYLYFDQYATNSPYAPLSNPGLKPEKDINYEIGFEQALSKNFKITLGAYYSEKRDQVVVYHFQQAYPASYYSYTNMDFGTTQGFTFGMVLRKIKNLGIRANYTLQFAKGTGSTASSSLALIRSGATNLRTLTALSFDQRHKVNVILQYNFSQGSDYNGPITRKEIKNTGKIREIKWFQLAGINLTFSGGSGLPYTASSEPYSNLVNLGDRVVQGSINGSRMPWIFKCDLNIYKGFPLVLKDSDDPSKRKMGSIVVSLDILNLFQLDQIDDVYPYTGSPTDDGFLTASKYQAYINSQDNRASFVDYYTIAMEGVNRLGGPRRFELGIRFEF